MKFEQGNKASAGAGKTKKTLLGKDIIETYFIQDGGIKKLLQTIDSIADNKERASAMLKLLEFYMPKQKEVQNNVFDGMKFEILEMTEQELETQIAEYEKRNKDVILKRLEKY